MDSSLNLPVRIIFWDFASGWDHVTTSYQWEWKWHVSFPGEAFKNLLKDLYSLNIWWSTENLVKDSEAFIRKSQCWNKRSLGLWITVWTAICQKIWNISFALCLATEILGLFIITSTLCLLIHCPYYILLIYWKLKS